MEKINPLIYTLLLSLIGIYVGILRVAAIAVRGIAALFMQPITWGTFFDFIGNLVLLVAGLGMCALFIVVGICVAGAIINRRIRR